MPTVAVMGSISSHGGVIITASGDVTSSNQQQARTGDLHACPIIHHGVTPVTATQGEVTADNIPVVCVGDTAGCGATILTGADEVSVS